MKLALVGATGMVGNMMMRILEERKSPISTFLAVASKKSIGKEILFNGQSITIIGVEDALSQDPDIAIFSAGGVYINR